MDDTTRTELEAAAFRALMHHLMVKRPDVQNIDLMNLAGFCRNCLAKWYRAAAEERGEVLDNDQAREIVYGEPYKAWQAKHQKEATPDKLATIAPGAATGRRKEAVARVRIVPGTGVWTVNGKPLEEYLPNKLHQQIAKEAFAETGLQDRFDVIARVTGGGMTGQAGALRLGVARQPLHPGCGVQADEALAADVGGLCQGCSSGACANHTSARS